MRGECVFVFLIAVFVGSLVCAATPKVADDAMRGPALRDVRLKGVPAEKMNDLFVNRLTGAFARKYVFGEARRAFQDRDDDRLGHGGIWRGEFWGKLMLGAARVADYLNDPEYIKWIGEECHRLMKLQDPDGYLGSYADKDLISIVDYRKTLSVYGWGPVWNIWNRKYAMWAMLMAYKTTRDGAILGSVVRQADQLIGTLRRRKLRLHETGAYGMHGLPSMSILKPMVMLYEETGERRFLNFAVEMLQDWDRADGECPNFFRNAKKPIPLHEWYPEPGEWAKTYEFLSCVDGLVECYRATGDVRCLNTARAIRDNLVRTDANVFGSVGFGDKMIGAPLYCNALNEVCDVIHWIRLNVDLFLVTGEDKYLESVEVGYYNGFLAGIFRGGAWGPFFIRGHQRHQHQFQCGYAYNHCCVNNLPRTFMDVASVVVTRDGDGVFHVNLYQDADVTLDGVRFEIRGNYPVEEHVSVRVSDPNARVRFRKPEWCPRLDVDRSDGGYELDFDMNVRIVDRLETVPSLNVRDMEKSWAYRRYPDNACGHMERDVLEGYRVTPAAIVMKGPLLLAKSRLAGTSQAEVEADTGINGKGYSAKLTVLPPNGYTWGRWQLELSKPGEMTVTVPVCDFQSGSDILESNLFSIWF